MGISVSLILIAVGAILTWAVTTTVSGIDINVVGVILMIVGAAGLILSMLFWSSWGGFHSTRTDTTIVRDDARSRAERRPHEEAYGAGAMPAPYCCGTRW